MRVTTLAGTGTQRGLDLGHTLASEVAATSTAFKTHLAATGHPPDQLGRRLAASGLVRTAADLVPDLWAEVVAIAGGARVPLEDVLLLVFLDEVWALTRRAGCSTIARVIDDPRNDRVTTELAQTMDLPAWSRDRAQVLRITGRGVPAALVLAYPGSIGLCGANEAGVGVAVNALPRAAMSESGLGVQFIIRHLLTLETLADAEAFLTTVPHAAGQAYTVAARDGIACFESDAAGTRRITPAGATVIAHTNHWLAQESAPENAPVTESSRERLTLLTHCLQSNGDVADVLTQEVAVDGERWGDPFTTFAAFRAMGEENCVRVIDGEAIRAGHREWTKVAFG